MKIISRLTIFTLVVTLMFACTKPEKAIIGSWTNSKTEVTHLDEVTKALFKKNKEYFENMKSLYEGMMNKEKTTDSMKTMYQGIIAQLDDQIAKLNIDSIKNELQNNFLIGSFTFNPDSTAVLVNKGDSVKGTWYIKKCTDKKGMDTVYVVIQNNPVPLQISKIGKNEMVLVQNNNIDSLKFDINYIFEKK